MKQTVIADFPLHCRLRNPLMGHFSYSRTLLDSELHLPGIEHRVRMLSCSYHIYKEKTVCKSSEAKKTPGSFQESIKQNLYTQNIPHLLGDGSALRAQVLLLQCLLDIRERLLSFLDGFSATFLDFFGAFGGYCLCLLAE